MIPERVDRNETVIHVIEDRPDGNGRHLFAAYWYDNRTAEGSGAPAKVHFPNVRVFRSNLADFLAAERADGKTVRFI